MPDEQDEQRGFRSFNNDCSHDTKDCIKKVQNVTGMAQQGRIRGLAFAISYVDEDGEEQHFDIGACGIYRTHPLSALAALNLLRLKLEQEALNQNDHDL